jgi:uncharacterized protein YifN (PemK superfamily)
VFLILVVLVNADERDKAAIVDKVKDVEKLLQERHKEYTSNIKSIQVSHDREIQRLKTEHVQQLNTVDEKVRSAIGVKDQLILQLKGRVDELEHKNKGTESVLKELYKEVSGIRR